MNLFKRFFGPSRPTSPAQPPQPTSPAQPPRPTSPAQPPRPTAPQAPELFDAVENGNCERVRALIASGVDVNGRNSAGEAILRHAIVCSSWRATLETVLDEMIDVLLSAGADTKARDVTSGATPIMLAASRGKAQLVQKLIESGAEASLDDRAREMVIQKTEEGWGRKTIGLRTLLKASKGGRAWLESSPGKRRAFVWAVSDGDCEGVCESLAGGSDPNARDVNGTPVIHRVVHVEAGSSNRWMMSKADQQAAASIIDALIDAGAEVNATDSMGSTVLMLAAEHRDALIVQRLIERGADGQLKNRDGRTVFEIVRAQKSWFDDYRYVLAVLVNATADGLAWLRSAEGKQWSSIWLEIDPAAPLPVCRADSTGVISEALDGKNSEGLLAIQRWVEEGGDLEWKGPNGFTLLHLAARRGNEKMIRFLLAHGANIESRDNVNGTPLMLACNIGFLAKLSPSTVALLLDSGANPSAEDRDGNTALSLIRRSGNDAAKAIVTLLEQRGAQRIPGKTTSCLECGAPESLSMIKRGVQVTVNGVFAEFACPACGKPEQVPLEAIDKTKGIQVSCPWCRLIAMVPPSVWCKTCGTGLSTGRQDAISKQN